MRFERWRLGILCRSCWDVKKAGEELDSSKANVVRSQLREWNKPRTVAIPQHVAIAWPYCQQKAKEEDRKSWGWGRAAPGINRKRPSDCESAAKSPNPSPKRHGSTFLTLFGTSRDCHCRGLRQMGFLKAHFRELLLFLSKVPQSSSFQRHTETQHAALKSNDPQLRVGRGRY